MIIYEIDKCAYDLESDSHTVPYHIRTFGLYFRSALIFYGTFFALLRYWGDLGPIYRGLISAPYLAHIGLKSDPYQNFCHHTIGNV